MTNELNAYLNDCAKELLAAPSACAEIKAAATNFIDAADDQAAKNLLAEAKADIMPIDGLIGFAGSDMGKKVFGDAAPSILAHAQQVKADGGKYCDCPACAACAKVIAKEAEIA